MDLHSIRGGTREALEKRQYNIGIGISLGNKWFTPERIADLIRWALPRTREDVVVYVADTIHAINLSVRSNSMSPSRALRIVKQQGQDLLSAVQKEVATAFSIEESNKIVYRTWDDLSNDAYKKKVAYLYDFYRSNRDFRKYIVDIVQQWTSKESRAFSETELEQLGTYLLEELPELMCRVPMRDRICDAYVYPFDGLVVELTEKLQRGELFPEIRENIMDTKPKVFLEVH